MVDRSDEAIQGEKRAYEKIMRRNVAEENKEEEKED